MEKRFDVVAMGELLIDFAQYGTSDQGNRLFEACPGGAPCNVLAMLNRLGRKTSFIGKVGEDQFGYLLRDVLNDLGIGTEGLLFDEEIPTTLAFVHTMPDGDRDFSFYRKPGADMMLKSSELNKDMIRQAKVFHFGTLSMTDEGIKEATLSALETAKASGALVSFDPNYRQPIWRSPEKAKNVMREGFRFCDILKISDNEVQFVTGEEDYDTAVRMIRDEFGIPIIFLTMGKNGSRAYYKDIRAEHSGFEVRAIETTGAGDTFCGCAIDGVLRYGAENLTKEQLTEILTFANAAAALITLKKGAIRSMPEIEEINKILGIQQE